MRPKDQEALTYLYGEALKEAARTGRRQRISWVRWPGRLNPCSSNFEEGFCCGEKPFTGYVLPIGGAWERD